ncbi:hypothetical protein GOP47_0007625 [Adiantum capillus-veneris]|uniref:B box-type domain-containing protein n=1 Tax=Adiantum capillus-veneris TaxID=13818 RepID=A0A9D4ZLP9_ADICA|nr:hypothetical protein GOP47_0007625 [Adiantum capillus-veneris]
MKLQCDVCVQAAATLFCCADEAALCAECDLRVHAANKLAGKHERLPLTLDHPPSSCDICQEKSGLFFCVEDRAILCRDCDVSIHTTNKLTRKHKRFLVSGVRVGLDAMVPPSLPSKAPSSQSSLMAGFDANMALPMSSHSSSVLPAPLESKTDSVQLENAQHREPQPPPLLPSGLEAHDPGTLTNIDLVESTPCMVPYVPLSQSSIFGPSMNNLSPSRSQQCASSSSMHFLNCLAHLDELLNGSPARTSSNETPPPMMSISNLGWNALDSTFAFDVLHASTNLFDNSLAEVPSTLVTGLPPPCFQDFNLSKRKRHMDESLYSSLDHTLVVANTILPPYKHTRFSF